MTVMIAGMPAIADAPPSPDAAPKAQASSRAGDPDRRVPFGPALQDARAAARVDDEAETAEAVSDDEANSDAHPEPKTAAHSVHATPATDVNVSVQGHPTAKGESGEGSPSIGHTVEAAATPTASLELDADGDLAPTNGPAGSDTSSDVNDSATQGATVVGRSGDDVAQASADLTASIDSATMESGGNPSGVTDVGGRGSTLANSESAARSSDASVGVVIDASKRASGSTTVNDGGTLADVAAAADAGMSTGTEGQTSAVTAMANDDATSVPGSRPSGEGFDSTMAATRQEARAVGVTSTTPQTSVPDLAPTPGPLASAEGSLWDDVQLAFDRIRSSANGQEVRIRLRPAELGELVVQVRTSGDQVSVRLTASSAAAHQALVDDRLRLATELAKAGFDEGSVDIGLDDGAGSFGDARHDRNAQDTEHGRNGILDGPVVASARPVFEERDPIRTQAAFRPGRNAYSTINLTL